MVELSDEQYGVMWYTLALIATGYDGDNSRVNRERMITEAREACDALHIRYGKVHKDILGT